MFIFENRKIETDNHGYLKNSQEWKKSMVYLLAKHENIILTKQHWKIILFIREFYLKFNTSPSMRMLTKAISQQYGETIGNSCYLYNLFPNGPAKQATKLAGLPKPIKCI
ncbi:TusE/DsrC/DsvC family sulfur relay protein [Arsenophonus symbiont of Ornithomya chloropus]|uniref:TusE/DsrC/DsvC family sulfur relay protein n=1 Tax=Arsenophonus symbiont of Ornithomya chloropus TaxID=634121 RepID=UPI0032B2C20E